MENEKLTKQQIKEEAANQIKDAHSFALITIGEDGSCTSMFGDFSYELAASLALHDVMGDRSSFHENVTHIKDAIRKALSVYHNAKEDPLFGMFQLMGKIAKEDRKKRQEQETKKQDGKEASN